MLEIHQRDIIGKLKARATDLLMSQLMNGHESKKENARTLEIKERLRKELKTKIDAAKKKNLEVT